MIQFEVSGGIIILPVRAQAGARSNGIRGEQNGHLKVAVTQVAEKGKANKAIVAVLSRALKIPKSQIELIAGMTSTEKRFAIRGMTEEQLRKATTAATKTNH